MDNLPANQKHTQRPARRDMKIAVLLLTVLQSIHIKASRFFKDYRFKPAIAATTLTGVALFSAICIVVFSISAPEAPPTGTTASLTGSAPVQGFSVPAGIDLANVFEAEGIDTGSGVEALDRSLDIPYIVKPGETLSEIAYSYEVSFKVLAAYNKIDDPNRIVPGLPILIPSIDNEKLAAAKIANNPQVNVSTFQTAKPLTITAEKTDNGNGITVHFRIVSPSPEKLREFEWDLGDGRKAFRPDPSYEYSTPKTYAIKLSARDKSGNLYRSPVLYIDVPYPNTSSREDRVRFNVLSSPDETFMLKGSILKVARYSSVSDAPINIVETDDVFTKVTFKQPGYYGLTTLHNGEEKYESVFVSPLPSIHTDREDFNWYRTQYNTGTSSNCGPSTVSMAIGWATGSYFPVSSARQSIGWNGNGSTSFEELIKVVLKAGTEAAIVPLRTAQDLRNIIDDGKIAILLFHTSGVTMTRKRAETDLFGKYYDDSVGHYIIVKGYSLDGRYFIVYDPIPSDWNGNTVRYGDEISMLGRNRYYAADGLLASLRRRDMIAIYGPVKAEK